MVDKDRAKVCSLCGRKLALNNFYRSKSPLHDGYAPICKDCINEKIDPLDMESVYSILRQLDVPFIYTVWERQKDKPKPIGAYLREIHSLKQYEDMTWKDSIFEEETPPPNDEKKIYSKKWHGYYTQSEIDYLDNYLAGLEKDFNIRTTNHIDYAKKIAQASLAVNKAYQEMLDGKPGADKRYKALQEIFDSLSKSAQFAENTRSQNDIGLGNFGKVFEMVERHQWIPRHIPLEKDDIDKILDYYANIERSL